MLNISLVQVYTFHSQGLCKKVVVLYVYYSITSWDEFITFSLRNFVLTVIRLKFALGSNNIHQLMDELFWKYFDRFKDILALCLHLAIEHWMLCQIVYKNQTYTSKTLLEPMCQKKIMRETDNEAWEFLEDLAEITRYWKSNTEKSLAPHSTAKTNIHSINSSMATKAKLVILMHVIELLENQGFLVSQIAHPLINIVKIHTMLPMSIIS